jgi:hypothetical protein
MPERERLATRAGAGYTVGNHSGMSAATITLHRVLIRSGHGILGALKGCLHAWEKWLNEVAKDIP